jgi:hypothetical protein
VTIVNPDGREWSTLWRDRGKTGSIAIIQDNVCTCGSPVYRRQIMGQVLRWRDVIRQVVARNFSEGKETDVVQKA